MLDSKNDALLESKYYKNFYLWIMGHFVNHKSLFGIGYLLLFLATIVQVIIPLILQYFFDIALQGGTRLIIQTALLFFLLYTLNLVVGILAAYFNTKLGENIVRDVQIEFFTAIHKKSMSFHDSARTGELLSMATSDSRQLSWMMTSFRMLSIAILTTIGVTLSMIYLDIRLLMAFLIFLPFIVLAIYYHGKKLAQISVKRQKLFATWQATLQENISGIRALRTLSNRHREHKKFENDLSAVKKALIKRGIISARYYSTLLIYLAMGVSFLVGAYFVYQGELTAGSLIAFNSLIFLILRVNNMIRTSIFLGSMGFAGGQRVYNLIIKRQSLDEKDENVPDRLSGHVKFDNVNFSYEGYETSVLKNVSFEIEPGMIVAILGHTGAGKTTLVKLLQRLYDPIKGSIYVDGIDIRKYDLEKYRQQIGVIEQDIFLFSATIKENILYGFENKDSPKLHKKMVEMAKTAQIHNFIDQLPQKYDTKIGERGITLSGGQRQRIAITRALMINPPILIMDDSTSAVDAHTEAEIQTALRNAMKTRTTLTITHRLSTIRNADLVILLEQGRIKDIGTHTELYERQPDYAEIFQQFESLPSIPDKTIEKPTVPKLEV